MSEEQNQTVVETIKGNIKILRFNQPNRKNAADLNAYIKIRQALKEAADNCDISMVILTGTGDFYCSGNDLKDHRDKGPELTNELLDRIKEMVIEFVLFPKPLVAIVNGPAVGIAVTTLALCDFVFAAEHAYFYAPFTKLGVVPEACSTYTFPKLIGYRKALELLLLNQRISSKEAVSCGLVNNVWGIEELEDRAWEKIEVINNIPTDTFVKAKKLFRQPILKQLLETNDAEIDTLKTFVGLRSRL
ncbi:enoyl-CoA delta isomerase 3, peroxisomal [Aricia agestis]|uniref:enoyl-CoA delta isomerase 3, peroxisomal n=1 Tax=Aricia agestis TaxID=91739 RepID=UPI001C204F74|nr:enoyl-CoA delta isomerase 3, peroxisomal [Aricia agestis]XP_041986601.1 enoyl-CoA delta isomerase 3, peroxisomal [Aricia agestis]